jgi:RecA/RadA recombinase
MLNYDEKACRMVQCDSLESWQKALTWFIENNQKSMTGSKERPGPGRIIPFCIGIDSLMSKASEETIGKVLKAGFSERAHPLEAMKISQFMKVWPQKLTRWPFSVVGTNHLKPTTDFMGRPGRALPGGMSLKFQETYELEMARVGDVHKSDHDGVTVTITARKNSLGPSRKQIKASLVWWNEYIDVEDPEAPIEDTVDIEVDDVPPSFTTPVKTVQAVQRTMWNWNSATIDLLLEIQSKDSGRWKKIKDFFDMTVVRTKGNNVWSDTLGISRDEPISFSRAGAMLEERPDLLNRLHALLGVRERLAFEPGKDMQLQMKDAKILADRNASRSIPAESQLPDPLEPDYDDAD